MCNKKNILFFLLFFGITYFSIAQNKKKQEPLTRILFVFDGSQSMLGKWQSGKKIDIAYRLMGEMLDSLEEIENKNFELALRVYGHQKSVPPQDCNDTKLEIPFGGNNVGKIKNFIRTITPRGTTPIARSLERAANDFPSCKNCRNIIILITDGKEECNEDPCSVSRMLQKKGIILKPFVIGIGLDKNFKESFECIGNFFEANDEKSFQNILGVVISQALNNTTAQVNLLDINANPTETDVNMTFYDRLTGAIKYNYIHTINNRGNPDTLVLDPLLTYDLVVNTIPPISKDSINIKPGKHNIIALDSPQGTLELNIPYSNSTKNLKAIIKRRNGSQTIHVQNFNTSEKYITGSYDVEILTLPRYKESITIKQSTNTTLSIPKPGLASIISTSQGYGSIYVEKENRLEWVCNLDDKKTQQSYYLQPGYYRVVFRPKNSKQSIYTIDKKFEIFSGSSNSIKLY